jgi:hypothetical protein
MYSDKDFQTFWFCHKTEGEPHGIFGRLRYSIILYVMNGKQNNKGIRHDDSTNTDNETKELARF